jgi:hypothetical protein
MSREEPWSKIAGWDSDSRHPAHVPRDFAVDELPRTVRVRLRLGWLAICRAWDDARGQRAVTLARRVRASLSVKERFALSNGHEPDLTSAILFALACVLDHSPKGDAYLVTAAHHLLSNEIRHARAMKRRPDPDAVVVHLDDPDVEDADVVIADVLDTPLNHALAREAVEARVNGHKPKPLANASARLRRLSKG